MKGSLQGQKQFGAKSPFIDRDTAPFIETFRKACVSFVVF